MIKYGGVAEILPTSLFKTLTTQTSPLPTQPRERKEKNKQTKKKKTSSPPGLSLVKHKVNVPPAWKKPFGNFLQNQKAATLFQTRKNTVLIDEDPQH